MSSLEIFLDVKYLHQLQALSLMESAFFCSFYTQSGKGLAVSLSSRRRFSVD